MTKQFSSFCATACALILALGAAAPAGAATPRAPAVDSATPLAPAYASDNLKVTAGKAVLLRLNEDATSVFVADPNIADVRAPSPRTVFVMGKKGGTTTLYVLGNGNRTILQRTVQVARDMDMLRALVSSRFPGMNIQVTEGAGSLQLTGEARSAADADAVVQALTPYLEDKEVLVNRMTVAQPQQVELLVRITEVDRNVTQQLGINWQSLGNAAGNFYTGIFSGRAIYNTTLSATGATQVNLPSNNAFSLFGAFTTNNWNIQALIDALNQEGLVTVLAEPNLVALSGQTASFIAGGEFPIPVSQINGALSVDFKEFGVKLDFTPTVMSDDRISLKVRPEVSQIDTANSITEGGTTIPGLSVRRADTTVELGDGQTFAIAGLLQTNSNDLIYQVPGLGSIPILGKLFTSKSYQNNKTELVIMVTPYIVKPTDRSKLRDALQEVTAPGSDIEYSLQHDAGNATPAPAASNQPRLVGAAGYVY